MAQRGMAIGIPQGGEFGHRGIRGSHKCLLRA